MDERPQSPSKKRLDQQMVLLGLVRSRSQAASYIKLGSVSVNNKIIKKTGHFVKDDDQIKLDIDEQYVSRAGLKLASVAEMLGLEFKDRTVLDVGSSTGGFTDFALRRGAKKVYAVDVGTDQLHPTLRDDPRISLYEKTDIRDFRAPTGEKPGIVLIDVSFISLREILPHIKESLSGDDTQIVAMVKPQFEANSYHTHKGVIKNEKARRQILQQFEDWVKQDFVIKQKRDSSVKGEKGNTERFYLLTIKH